MAGTSHKHYFGFALPEDALVAHLRLDHGLGETEVKALGDGAEAAHAAKHPEITTPVSDAFDLGSISARVLNLQDAVDQLILNDLLDL